MRFSDYLAIIAIVVLAYISIMTTPKIITTTSYLKGDTLTVIDTITVQDTIKVYVYNTKHDTVRTTDTVFVNYWTLFNLGNDTLGTSGKVVFDMNDFKFSDIKYRYPETIKTVVDTLKIKEVEDTPLYKNSWFYSTIALILTLLTLVAR